MLLLALLVACRPLLPSARDDVHFIISLDSHKNNSSVTGGDYSEVQVPVDSTRPNILPALVGQDRPDSALSAVTAANERFSQHLYFQLSQDSRDNLVVSPCSISMVMAMVWLGAQGNALTQLEKRMFFPHHGTAAGYRALLSSLNSSNQRRTKQPRTFTLHMANKMFFHNGFEPKMSFRKQLMRDFYSDVVVTDFARGYADQLINYFVEDITRGKIKDLIGPGVISASTKMILVNAIYFKADWQVKFDKLLTKDDYFYTNGGGKVKVPTMHLKSNFEIADLKELDSQVLRLPYKGGRIVMDILLPNTKDGLDSLEKKLLDIDLWTLVESNKYSTEVVVSLPKFQLSTSISLRRVLEDLGVTEIFHGGLGGITDQELAVTEVVQKAVIEVNEEGTEAAAATAILMGFKSSSFSYLIFTANHPFIFFIRDEKTGMLLFQGRVSNPAL